MKILIIANGDIQEYTFYQPYISECDYIICADGGTRHSRKLNILPDIVLGDLDSSRNGDIEYYQDQGVGFTTFPSKKDKTDTQLAVEHAVQLNPTYIYIIGATGTRLDHTLANIHLLSIPLSYDIEACLLNEYNMIHLMKDKLEIQNGGFGTFVSLIPFTNLVKGVTTEGLAYPLNNAILRAGDSYGVSNEMTDSAASITIQSGKLIVIQSRD